MTVARRYAPINSFAQDSCTGIPVVNQKLRMMLADAKFANPPEYKYTLNHWRLQTGQRNPVYAWWCWRAGQNKETVLSSTENGAYPTCTVIHRGKTYVAVLPIQLHTAEDSMSMFNGCASAHSDLLIADFIVLIDFVYVRARSVLINGICMVHAPFGLPEKVPMKARFGLSGSL